MSDFRCAVKNKRFSKSECKVCFVANESKEQTTLKTKTIQFSEPNETCVFQNLNRGKKGSYQKPLVVVSIAPRSRMASS